MQALRRYKSYNNTRHYLCSLISCRRSLIIANESFYSETKVTHVPNLHKVIQLCAKERAATEGMACHAQIIRIGFEADILTSNMIINMYSKCGMFHSARKLFDEMPERSLVSWNTVIGSLTQNGDEQQALAFFVQMRREGNLSSEFTLSSVLCACAAKCFIFECTQLHAFAIKVEMDLNVFVGTALLDVYAKCSLVEDANRVFQSMPKRSAVTWSSMVAGYVQNDLYEEALELFRNAHRMGIEQDEFMTSSALSACAGLAVLNEANQVHALSCKSGFEANLFIAASLVDMYSKCGCIRYSYLIFQGAAKRSLVLWNAIISGFAKHSHSLEAVILFEKMQQTGLFPNEVTYVSVLHACSHNGLHNEGKKYFNLMVLEHGVSPNVLHYSCMVDILGRAGLVHEAYDLIVKIPFSVPASIWGSLLASCRTYGHIEFAEIAAKHLFELEPENAGNHVLLSNIYAAHKKWEDVARTRKFLKDSAVKKKKGMSWIEIKNEVHSFMVGDRNHHRIVDIYSKLDSLMEELKELDYNVDIKQDLHDVDESRKKELLRHHSEKLALTFGLMCLPHDVPIRIMKNLRICGDCHCFVKLISKLTGRVIIIRDLNRFHHFEDGYCSCKDFW